MSIFSERRLVLFDFDGVIVDSMELNLQLNAELNFNVMEPDDYRRLFMGNIFETIKTHYKESATETNIDAYGEAFGQRLQNLVPREKISEMLATVAGNRTAYVVTSSSEKYVSQFLKKHQLDQYFTEVHGQETHYSKVVKFRRIMQREAVTADEAVFITDTVGDVLEADEVGVDSIAVTWGFHPKEWLQDSPHHTMVHTVDELTELF